MNEKCKRGVLFICGLFIINIMLFIMICMNEKYKRGVLFIGDLFIIIIMLFICDL